MIGSLIFFVHQHHREAKAQLEKNEKTVQTSEADEKNRVIEDKLAQMTLEEKVGQLFWARVPADHQIEDLKSYHLSGYILFGRDFEGQTLEDMKVLTSRYQTASKTPLLIGSDEEGGQ